MHCNSYAETHPEIAEDLRRHPEKARLLGVLTRALGEQISVVREGIKVHAVKCSKEMMPLHEHFSGGCAIAYCMLVSGAAVVAVPHPHAIVGSRPLCGHVQAVEGVGCRRSRAHWLAPDVVYVYVWE